VIAHMGPDPGQGAPDLRERAHGARQPLLTVYADGEPSDYVLARVAVDAIGRVGYAMQQCQGPSHNPTKERTR
jgi:hypothetical protein